MQNAFIGKPGAFAALSAGDKTILAKACGTMRTIPRGAELARVGERVEDLFIILHGFACRSTVQPNGDESITSYLVPGDIADQYTFILPVLDHTIYCLSQCTVARIRQEEFLQLLAKSPKIIRALWWSTLVDEATTREWVVGARHGPKRVAHLLCELLMRLKIVGLVQGSGYTLPITQTELGRTTGLSTVHINRVLRTLRERNLVTWDAKQRIKIPDIPRLKSFSGFDPGYLHVRAHGHSRSDSAMNELVPPSNTSNKPINRHSA